MSPSLKIASPKPLSSALRVNHWSSPPLVAEPVSRLSVLAIAANWVASSSGLPLRAASLSYVAWALALAVAPARVVRGHGVLRVGRLVAGRVEDVADPDLVARPLVVGGRDEDLAHLALGGRLLRSVGDDLLRQLVADEIGPDRLAIGIQRDPGILDLLGPDGIDDRGAISFTWAMT